MISDQKKAELDAVAAIRAIPVAAPVKVITLQSLDERISELERSTVKPKIQEQSNG